MAGFGFTSTNWCVWLPGERDVYRALHREKPPEGWVAKLYDDRFAAEQRADILGGVAVRADVMLQAYDALCVGALEVPPRTDTSTRARPALTSIEQFARRDP